MSDVTVIIPTARRADLLPVALRSVAAQTAVGRIARVIVSENSEDRASRDVCRRFPELPIEYLTQEPPVTPVQHLARLFGRSDLTGFASLLCDDDWWAPAHLEVLLRALAATPDASVAFSTAALVDSEHAAAAELYLPAAFHLVTEREAAVGSVAFDAGRVLASAWVHTPFHFSAMLARSHPLREVSTRLSEFHPYNADRLLFAELALRGSVIFLPQAGAFIRRHAGNYDQYTTQRELDRARNDGRRTIEIMGRGRGLDPAGLWKQYLAALPHGPSAELANLLWNYVGPEAMRTSGVGAALGVSGQFAWVKRLERATWQYAKPWLPPVFLNAYRRFRDRAARR